jgi:hypothetical protein
MFFLGVHVLGRYPVGIQPVSNLGGEWFGTMGLLSRPSCPSQLKKKKMVSRYLTLFKNNKFKTRQQAIDHLFSFELLGGFVLYFDTDHVFGFAVGGVNPQGLSIARG